ncbi:MAG: riboflavin synthase, partial [Burkholderiales bacterium]
MFTGLVAAVGRITRVEARPQGAKLTIDAGDLGLADVALGDSIAVAGCCLTAIALDGNTFVAEISQETIDCTVGLDAAGEVNLEKSLTLADRLGGHLVTGHVDGVGVVTRFAPVGDSFLLAIKAPDDLARYIARKGSIAVNGVSLTVNRVQGSELEINLIPHTLAVTTLKHVKAGSRVNLEIDLIARYVERMLGA